MTIKQGTAYKISPTKLKRYAAHYNILPERCLIVPVKFFGTEVSCDIRWEEDNGELRLLQQKIFMSENLVPLNAMLEPALDELWRHYYPSGLSLSQQVQTDQTTN